MQEAIVVIKDIFRKYPNKYESIISTLCENLDTLDEPEARYFLNRQLSYMFYIQFIHKSIFFISLLILTHSNNLFNWLQSIDDLDHRRVC